MARRTRLSIEAGDAFAADATLGISVGVDVTNGGAFYTAMQWDESGHGAVIDYGKLRSTE